MTRILFFLSVIFLHAEEHRLAYTLTRIEEMIAHRERGGYFCFDRQDVEMAIGMGVSFWDQVAMQEMISLDDSSILKSRFLPYNALNGHRPEDRWGVDPFSRAKDSWHEWYAPIAPAFLSTMHREECIEFFEFLRKQNLTVVGDIPQATRDLLFGSRCKFARKVEDLPNFADPYNVVLIAVDPFEKVYANRFLQEFDSIFVLDFSGLKDPLCNWDVEVWKKWLQKKNNLKILYTSALIPYKFDERKREYIKCLKILDGYGFKDQIYVVEAGPYTPLSFFENHCNHVFYANTNDTSYINKGVNESKSTMAAFEYFDFDDEDMIVKLTGRYLFNNDNFFNLIKAQPEIDAFASPFPNRGVTTGCFAMRYKYYKQMIQELDFEEMEENLIDIEWEVWKFIEKMALEGAKVMYLEKIGIAANVANVGIEQW